MSGGFSNDGDATILSPSPTPGGVATAGHPGKGEGEGEGKGSGAASSTVDTQGGPAPNRGHAGEDAVKAPQ